MSFKKAGTRRRAVIIASALVVAVALAAMSSGAAANSKCEEVLGTSTFTDPSGDGSGAGALDISDVTLTSYEGGATTFQIALPGVDAFSAGMLVRTYLDSDKTATTGSEKGDEYMIQTVSRGGMPAGGLSAKCEDQPISTLFAWSGSAWVEQKTKTLSSWYGDSTLTLTLNASEMGNALTFNFAIYAAANVKAGEAGWPDISGASFDWAPDTGSWTYQPFQWSSYSDPAGDGSAEGAPDISSVGVTKWKGSLLKFTIPVPGIEEFSEDMLMRILIDSDSNAATGDANGYEYMVEVQRVSYGSSSLPMSAESVLHALCYQPDIALFEWNGEGWNAVEGVSFDSWYSKGLELSFDSSAIGSPAAFNFAVYAATNVSFSESGWPDLTKEPASDRAPDTGSYGFPLAVSNADLVGVYKVTYHITRSTGHLSQKKVSTKAWSFQKRCSKKKCATKAIVKGQGNYKLSRAGKVSYRANSGKKISCSSASTRTTEKFSMNVKKSGWVKGKWRVTKWVGTLQVASARDVPKCGAGSYTASLTGTLKK
ncbi:MAG: hypothetical protein WBQ14_06430 [Gaiellaceae bacterium]